MKDSLLSKQSSKRGEYVVDDASGLHVFHVKDQHTFVQAAGYLKYVIGRKSNAGVFFRGQEKLYPTMIPTLYRGVKRQAARENRDRMLAKYLTAFEADKSALRAVRKHVREPLLQHYGIRTRWLDLVDNAWVALWFSCYSAIASGARGEFLHFERRADAVGEGQVSQYAYVVLVAAGLRPYAERPGVLVGDETELIDLRIAAPSFFIRPHAQHALLVRRRKRIDHNNMDYSDFVVGTIRVSLTQALEWLGHGMLTSVHSLFPPPTYDFGYRELLVNAPKAMADLGTIAHVGA